VGNLGKTWSVETGNLLSELLTSWSDRASFGGGVKPYGLEGGYLFCPDVSERPAAFTSR
jgi:hypothetical protein